MLRGAPFDRLRTSRAISTRLLPHDVALENMPMSTSGRMAALAIARLPLMPCDPVWLATIDAGVRKVARKYSFRRKIRKGLRLRPCANGSPIRRFVHDPDDDRQHHQGVDQNEATSRLFPVSPKRCGRIGREAGRCRRNAAR